MIIGKKLRQKVKRKRQFSDRDLLQRIPGRTGSDAGGKTQQMDNITFLHYNHIFVGLHSLASLVARYG